MVTHDLRYEDAYLDPGRARAGDNDLVTINGWGCGEDIRPGDFIVIGDDGAGLRYRVVCITSRYARGLLFWTAACTHAGPPQGGSSHTTVPLRLVTL